MTVFTDGLFVVREGQHGLTQAAALRERLLVHLVLYVANQNLRGKTQTHTHAEPRKAIQLNKQIYSEKRWLYQTINKINCLMEDGKLQKQHIKEERREFPGTF